MVAFSLMCSSLHLTEAVLAVRAPGGGKKAHLTKFPLALPLSADQYPLLGEIDTTTLTMVAACSESFGTLSTS